MCLWTRPMKCDRCEREATIHEVLIKGGAKVEKHLCEQCAPLEGIAVPPVIQVTPAVHSVPTAEPVLQPVRETSRPTLTCPECGMTFAQFRQGGLLGCAACYSAFEERLGPMLERAQEGASHHVGKYPRRLFSRPRGAGQPDAERTLREERARRVADLRRLLEQAVHAENYERAARIRDEIRMLDEPGGSR